MLGGVLIARLARLTRRDRLPSLLIRFLRLNAGLALMGFGIALMVQARIGLGPLEVFAQGLSLRTPLTIGQAIQVAGLAVVALSYLALKYRPGVGTLLNMVLVGLWVDLFVAQAWLPVASGAAWGVAQFMAGTLLMAGASGLYITARLGAGPNDSLMIGLSRTLGIGTGRVRVGIEAVFLVAGFLLGGSVGLGTVLFALTIGPLVQFFLRVLGRPPRERAG